MSAQLFQSLSLEEKVDFFIKCQELLVQYHPESDYIFREGEEKAKKEFIKGFVNKYKGFCYRDKNVCILFNRVMVKDPKDPIGELKANVYQSPQEEYNCVSVDFVVFRKMEDCIPFCKAQYEDKIKYLLYVKHNGVKLYETAKLLSRAVKF